MSEQKEVTRNWDHPMGGDFCKRQDPRDAKIAEQEREIAELRERLEQSERFGNQNHESMLKWQDKCVDMNKQIAATQQQAKGMREALAYGKIYAPSGSITKDVITKALSIPLDTAAIDALEAKYSDVCLKWHDAVDRAKEYNDKLTAANEVIKVAKDALAHLHGLVIEHNRNGADWGDLFGRLMTALSNSSAALVKINELEGK